MRRVILSVLILATAGCSNPLASNTRDVILHVSDIAVPTSAPPNARITATVTVVTGGCKRFERFEVAATPASATIEARGTDNASKNVACTADVRYEPKMLELSGPFSDPFTIRATQPDGTFLTKTVRIQ